MAKASLSPSLVAAEWLPTIAPLRCFRGEWYSYEFGVYVRAEKGLVRRRAYEFIREKHGVGAATSRFITEVVDSARHQVFVDGSRTPPFWLGDEPDSRMIVMSNGVVHLDRAIAGYEGALQPHSHDLFSLIKLPYAFNPAAECTTWDAFMTWFTQGDQTVIDLLAEFAAWCLLPDLALQRFVEMVGTGRNGKSVFALTLVHLLGAANVSAVQLESFGRRFQLTPTLGKLLNLISDASEVDRLSEGTLKAFVAQDWMMFDVKGREPITARPTARLLILCNRLPRWRDRSDGLSRRRIIVRCTSEVVYEDASLPDQLAAEAPGIFYRWLLPGARRLLQREKFLLPASCQAELVKARLDTNPALRFCEEELLAAPEAAFITHDTLYGKYVEWCRAWGYIPLSYSEMNKEIAAAFPQAKKDARRGPKHGYRPRGWAGLDWRGDREYADEQISDFADRPVHNPTQPATEKLRIHTA